MALAAMFPTRQFLDDTGAPLASGSVYTYQAGTATALATYADALYVSENPNPLVLDAGGRGQMFLLPRAYKLVVKDADNVTIEEIDNYQGQGGEWTVTQISAAYTPDYDDDIIEITAGGPFTITLPTAVNHAGKIFSFKSLVAATITVDGNSSETIDGAATNASMVAANDGLTIWSDGSNWKILCIVT